MTMPLQAPDGQPIERANEADIPALARMLAAAFAADPFWRWLVGNGDDVAERMELGFAAQLRHLALPHGLVYCTPARTAAALWSPPSQWHLGLRQQLQVLPDFIAAIGWRRLLPVQRAIHAVQKVHPAQPHYYLQVLGVDPACQGQGLGHTLLAPMLRMADQRHTPVYLETANPDNLGFYRRYGFELTSELSLPAGAPPLWLMWRPAP
ncbi:MAG: GNAT family N-acetyltransferase [Alcanivoracaceae bacterium]|nr:GNAT family N-acetyltransferase [Alcanivoracaceae bacterium]